MAVGLPAFQKGRSVRDYAVVNKMPAEHRLELRYSFRA
jgi:hypothetical protein